MTALPKRRRARGFTLIELMVVVLILSVLATIVYATVGSATSDSKQVALSMTLRTFRNQIQTYSLQHNNTAPDGTLLPDLLMQSTDVSGNRGTGPQYPLGPYLASLPKSPYGERSDVKVVATGGDMVPDNTTAWLYRVDPTGFTLVANSSASDSNGKPLVDY